MPAVIRATTIHATSLSLVPPSPSPSSNPHAAPRQSPSPSPSSRPSLAPPSPNSAKAQPASGSFSTASSASSLSPASRYQLTSSLLGKGHFARVTLALDTVTGVNVAIKVIDKKEMVKNRSIVESEMSILKRMGRHRHIVSMLDFFEDDRRFFIVMELCSGGDLFSRIVDQGKYSEQQAVRCCRQIAEALVYIHSCGITHRDLKPENILLLSSAIDSDIKLADFGLSKILPNIDDVMRTVCGTWAYTAPEVIAHKSYTSKVDNWTLGVLMYILLCGYHPFDCYGDLPEPELLDKIMRVDFEFEDPVWDEVSADAKRLISALIVYQPEDRLSLTDFLQSDWILSGGKGGSGAELSVVQARLSKFTHHTLRALVTAKVAIKKFRASISKSPRTPSTKSQQHYTHSLAAAVHTPGGDDGDGSDGDVDDNRRGEGSLSGLSFLNRLDKKDVPRGSGSVVRVEEKGTAAAASAAAAQGVKEKGGLGRGMRISEEDRELSASEEKEAADDDDRPPL